MNFPEYEFKDRGGRFSESTLDFKMTIQEKGCDTPELARAKTTVKYLGIPMENEKYQIVGLKGRRVKMPWIYLEKSTGKQFVTTESNLIMMMGEDNKA